MKKIMVTALALLAALSICACGNNDGNAPMGYTEISDKDVGYNLYIPDDENWSSDISTGVTTAYHMDKSNISVTAFALTENKSINEFWENDYAPTLIQVFPDLTYVSGNEESKSDITKLADKDAAEYIYTGTMSGVKYKFMQRIAYHNNTMYIFTYTAEEAKYDSHIKEVLEILSFFEFN